MPDVAPAGDFADDHAHLVADGGGIDVLVALGHLRDRGDVDPALVRERAPSDIRRVGIRMLVRHFGHVQGDLREA